jgi:ABC-type uncharacterized transport system permease subunit
MSTVAPVVQPTPTPTPNGVDFTFVKSWKVTIALTIFTVLGFLLLVVFGRDGVTTLRLSTSRDLIQLPDLALPTRVACLVISILLALITGVSAWLVRAKAKTPIWLIATYAVLLLVGFLAWAAADKSIPVPGLLFGSLSLAVPLIFGALGGVISERAGVVNIAIEGQLLAGAFTSAMVASLTRQPLLGLVAAMLAGVLVGMVLAAFSIKYFVDQVIVGVVLNVLVIGLTGFLYSQVMAPNAALLNQPARFERINVPLLSEIPIVGPVFFRQTLIVYIMYVAVAVVYYGIFHTKWGLRLRSVGEHPQAADTVGINVAATRFWNVSIAGAVVGLGGAYFTLGSVGAFGKEMTAGAGFIALAAVIFGRWDPIRATLAALLFGFASNLQNVLSIIGSPVPSEFMLMLPYLVTIFAVAGLVGQSRGPAASGKPYVKS